MNYRAAILNTKEFPTDPKDIQMAIKKASVFEDENRDVRDLMSLEERAMSCVPKMTRHKLRRTSHVSSATWAIVPIDENNEEHARLAEEAEKRLSSIIKQYTKRYIEGDLFGVSVQRLKWEITDYGFKPQIDYNYNPYELERNHRYNYGVSILQQAEHNQFVRTEIQENEKHNYLVYVPDYPEPGGILRTVIYACYMINLSRQEWSQYIQFLKGIIQAKTKLGASPEDKKAAAEAVRKAVKNKATVTSDLVEFIWERLNNENAGKSFDAFLQSCYEEVEVAITNTTMMATDRERNALTVLERGEEDLAREMRFEFELLINDMLLRHDYYMNVDKSAYGLDVPYEFVMHPKLKQDRTANANIMLDAINSGLKFQVKTWNEKTGIPLADDEDQVISLNISSSLNQALEDENQSDDT
jgi:hypothetical protein